MSDEGKKLGGSEGGADHLTPSEMGHLARSACRYPITPKDRAKAVKACRAVMKSDKPRYKLSAVRTLAALDAMNMEQEKRDAEGSGGQEAVAAVTVIIEEVSERAGTASESVPAAEAVPSK